MKTEQVEMVSVEQLVPEKHTYRRLKTLLDFDRGVNLGGMGLAGIMGGSDMISLAKKLGFKK